MRLNLWQVEGVGKSAKVIHSTAKSPAQTILSCALNLQSISSPFSGLWLLHLQGPIDHRGFGGGLIYFVPDLPLPVIGHHVGACHKTGRITLKLSCHGGRILLSKKQCLLML